MWVTYKVLKPYCAILDSWAALGILYALEELAFSFLRGRSLPTIGLD